MFEYGDIVQNAVTGENGIVIEIPRNQNPGTWLYYMNQNGRCVTVDPQHATLVLRPPVVAYEHIAAEKRADQILAS